MQKCLHLVSSFDMAASKLLHALIKIFTINCTFVTFCQTNHFWRCNLQHCSSRSQHSQESVSTEGIADVFMCHKLVSGEAALRKHQLDCFEKDTQRNKPEKRVLAIVHVKISLAMISPLTICTYSP